MLRNRYGRKGRWLCLLGCLAILLSGNAVAGSRDLDVQLSWFIDMDQYHASAHGGLFCIECHGTIQENSGHPDPDNVSQEADSFFNMKSCGESNCHENTLSELEKGVHGRIRFQNREKYENCIDCHDPHKVAYPVVDPLKTDRKGRYRCQPDVRRAEQPDECEKDRKCLECHSMPAGDPGTAEREASLCLHCHGRNGQFAEQEAFSHIPVMDRSAYAETPHADIRCTYCHTQSATYGHEGTLQSCRQCHPPHDEKPIHDAHLSVDCKACHLHGDIELNQVTGRIRWIPGSSHQDPVTIHQMVPTEKPDNCVRCHTSNNPVQAAAMVLPAKSVICASCHTATLSVSDPVTMITLACGILVILVLSGTWLSAEPSLEKRGAVAKALYILRAVLAALFSRRIVPILKAFFLDAILQRKLFARSPFRWFSHGLIFYPFLLRFGWGIITLLLSLAIPESEISRSLLDKNNPLVAFIFDITGVLIIVGVLLIIIRRIATRKSRWPGLPSREWLSLVLVGGIIGVGFLLEGLRIAMTVDHAGRQFAFLGYAISLLFNKMETATEIYGYVWYLHAILTGVFLVWLPFSRMFHMVMGPVAIAINAARKHR